MGKFKQFAKYPTRNGGTALMLHVGHRGGGTAALHTFEGIYSGTIQFFPNGRVFDASENPWDILPPEPEKWTSWANVYRRGDGTVYCAEGYETRAQADASAGVTRIGCHRVVLRAEFEDAE